MDEVKLFLDLLSAKTTGPINTLASAPSLDFSKRVYQGVRVKHTVKDLLAEKRSQQTNGPRYSVSTLLLSSSASAPLHLSRQNKQGGRRVDILLVPQLRGRLFRSKRRRRKKSHLLSLFTFWLGVVDRRSAVPIVHTAPANLFCK